MGRPGQIERYLASEPLMISQREDDPLYFDWIHTPGREECERILEWFAEQGLKPFIAEQGPAGGSEFAGHCFYDRPDLAALFKLTFL